MFFILCNIQELNLSVFFNFCSAISVFCYTEQIFLEGIIKFYLTRSSMWFSARDYSKSVSLVVLNPGLGTPNLVKKFKGNTKGFLPILFCTVENILVHQYSYLHIHCFSWRCQKQKRLRNTVNYTNLPCLRRSGRNKCQFSK